jgi:orotidine-5'-phosphate decarboxylase
LTFDAHPRSSLIVALDFDSLSSALKFAEKVGDLVGMFKVGSQLFTTAGPEAVRQISKLGCDIFLDLNSTTFQIRWQEPSWRPRRCLVYSL